MNFSICVPTRNRPNNIIRLMHSIDITAADPENIQIIFRVDLDDKLSEKVIKTPSRAMKRMILGKRGDLSDMWEDCLPYTKSNRLMMCADDVVFRTKNWDSIMSEQLPEDEIWFAWGNDKIHKKGLATLPMVSRKWVQTVGYFVPKGYARDYCDTHLHNVARRVKAHGYDVMKYFDDVVFEHMHPGAKKAKMDDTYKYRLSKPSTEMIYKKRADERENDALKLIEELKK